MLHRDLHQRPRRATDRRGGRKVQHRADLLVETEQAHVVHHADDLDPRRVTPDLQLLAQRPALEEPVGKGLAHPDDVATGFVIRALRRPTLEQAHAHRLEVAGQDRRVHPQGRHRVLRARPRTDVE